MKITLTKNSVEWTGEWNSKKIRFCQSVLRKLKVTGDMVNLEISLFAEKGYSQIDLTKLPVGCWRCRFPKRPSVIGNGDTSCFYFPFDDNTVDDMLTALGFRNVHTLLGCSLWIKFVPIPKCVNYQVKMYAEVCTEVTVFMPVNSTPQAVADKAMACAKMIPASQWQGVPDSVNCDPATYVQKSI